MRMKLLPVSSILNTRLKALGALCWKQRLAQAPSPQQLLAPALSPQQLC
jgi:hypothetical protein